MISRTFSCGWTEYFRVAKHAESTGWLLRDAGDPVLANCTADNILTRHTRHLSLSLLPTCSRRGPVFSGAFPSLFHAGRNSTFKRNPYHEQRRFVVR